MDGKQLGKILKWETGFHDYGFGVVYTLGGESWGVSSSQIFAAKYEDRFRYSREEWEQNVIQYALFERDTLLSAKKQRVEQLVGTPVEVIFEGNLLKSWRVLTEVL